MFFTLVSHPLRFFFRLPYALKMAYLNFYIWLQGHDDQTCSEAELNAGHILWSMTEDASDLNDMLLIFRIYITEREREKIVLRRRFRICAAAIIILLLLLS